MEDIQVSSLCLKFYRLAFVRSQQDNLDLDLFANQLQTELQKSKVSFTKLKKYVKFSRKDWMEDLLEIIRDIKLVNQTKSLFTNKLKERALKHFGNGHKQGLQKLKKKYSPVKKVISMYQKNDTKEWKQSQIDKFSDKVLGNTVYFVGLLKANGVIVQNQNIVTCAHALIDDDQKIIKYRCFVTGNGACGIAKVQSKNLFMQADVGIANIIQIYDAERNHPRLTLKIPKKLKFKNQFQPIRCLQVGLLFNNQLQDSFIKVFQSAQGFVEKNLYLSLQDHRLIQEMGLLVHDCYGLWGTSGSPLWDQDGQLIGIHNSWNQIGYNINMIVHDDDTSNIRVVKQYERRAVSEHVLSHLYEKFKEHKGFANKKGQGQLGQQNDDVKPKKRVKRF